MPSGRDASSHCLLIFIYTLHAAVPHFIIRPHLPDKNLPVTARHCTDCAFSSHPWCSLDPVMLTNEPGCSDLFEFGPFVYCLSVSRLDHIFVIFVNLSTVQSASLPEKKRPPLRQHAFAKHVSWPCPNRWSACGQNKRYLARQRPALRPTISAASAVQLTARAHLRLHIRARRIRHDKELI